MLAFLVIFVLLLFHVQLVNIILVILRLIVICARFLSYCAAAWLLSGFLLIYSINHKGWDCTEFTQFWFPEFGNLFLSGSNHLAEHFLPKTYKKISANYRIKHFLDVVKVSSFVCNPVYLMPLNFFSQYIFILKGLKALKFKISVFKRH